MALVVIGVVPLLAMGVVGLVREPDVSSLAGFVVCATLALGLVALGLARVECSVDPATRSLRLRSVRWPLGTVERTIPLDRIARIETQRIGSQSRRVVLVMHDGSEVPLTAGGSSSSAHGATASVLAGWLASS